MAFLILTFALVLVVSFVTVMLVTHPTTADKSIDDRLARIAVAEEVYLGEGSSAILKTAELSSLRWLDLLLKSIPGPPALQKLITQADARWSVGQVILWSILLGGFGGVFGSSFVRTSPWTVLLAVALATSPVSYLRLRRSRRMSKFAKGLPDAIDIVARSLRAGHSISSALEVVSDQAVEPIRSEFRTACGQQSLGFPFRDALLAMADRVPSADLEIVITGMLVQKETGGNLVEVLERISNLLRERQQLEGEMRVYTAQGRMTAWILGLLPGFLYFTINLVNPGYTRILSTDPIGQKMLIAGAVQITLGTVIIRKIVRVKL